MDKRRTDDMLLHNTVRSARSEEKGGGEKKPPCILTSQWHVTKNSGQRAVDEQNCIGCCSLSEIEQRADGLMDREESVTIAYSALVYVSVFPFSSDEAGSTRGRFDNSEPKGDEKFVPKARLFAGLLWDNCRGEGGMIQRRVTAVDDS